MTNEEIRLISDYRIVIAGSTDFTNNIKTELYKSGFKSITIFHQQTGIQILSLLI